EAGGPEQVDGKVGQALREARPLKLGEGHLGPVLLSLDDLAESPEREQSGEFDVRPGPGEAISDRRVFQGRRIDGTRGHDHGPQVGCKAGDLPGDADAFVAERAHRHEPSLALAAEAAVERYAGVLEEDLVEHLLAGHVPDWPHVDAWRPHVHY